MKISVVLLVSTPDVYFYRNHASSEVWVLPKHYSAARRNNVLSSHSTCSNVNAFMKPRRVSWRSGAKSVLHVMRSWHRPHDGEQTASFKLLISRLVKTIESSCRQIPTIITPLEVSFVHLMTHILRL